MWILEGVDFVLGYVSDGEDPLSISDDGLGGLAE
jgi:hypothetical protein